MGQTKAQREAAGLASLHRATDTLSTLLAQEVKELNARQKAAKKNGSPDAGLMKGLKDLAAVAKSLNDQGTETEGAQTGVVLMPAIRGKEETQ